MKSKLENKFDFYPFFLYFYVNINFQSPEKNKKKIKKT